MIHFTDYELEQYINEDIPYLDLTTHLQKVENKQARLEIITRENIVVFMYGKNLVGIPVLFRL